MNRKTLIICLTLSFSLPMFGQQFAAITNTNIQMHATLNSEPLALASNQLEIRLDKRTGDFEARVMIGDLYIAKNNPDFSRIADNDSEYFTLKGVIPVNDVLDQLGSVIDLDVELTVIYKEDEYPAIFKFTIMTMRNSQPISFSVMSNGRIPHSYFDAPNLKNAEDELVISYSFIGR